MCLLGMILFLLGSCSLFYDDFPEELQGRWEYEDAWNFEWFVVEGYELYYCRSGIYGSVEDERTMYLTECDESSGRLTTTDLFVLYRWEEAQLYFAYGEDDFPSDPEWKDVHPY